MESEANVVEGKFERIVSPIEFPVCTLRWLIGNGSKEVLQRSDFPLLNWLVGDDTPTYSGLSISRRNVYTCANGWRITLCRGSIDDYCAGVEIPDGQGRYWLFRPYDKFYFRVLTFLFSVGVSRKRIYEDVALIAAHTTDDIDESVLMLIETLSADYKWYCTWVRIAYLEIYYGFVAENCKEKAVLKCSIKLNALHQLLVRDWSLEDVVEWCCDRAAFDIARDCKLNGVPIFSIKLDETVTNCLDGIWKWPSVYLPRQLKTWNEDWYHNDYHFPPRDVNGRDMSNAEVIACIEGRRPWPQKVRRVS